MQLIATDGNNGLGMTGPCTTAGTEEACSPFAQQTLGNLGYNDLTEKALTWCEPFVDKEELKRQGKKHDPQCTRKRWVLGFELSARTVTWVVSFYEGVISSVLIAASTWLVSSRRLS